VLNGMLDRLRSSLPDDAGIVPERLPGVSFNGDHFIVTINDPADGAQVAIPVAPDAVMDTLVDAAHAAQAVVPQWELETVEAKYAAYRERVEAFESARRQADMDMVENDLARPVADYWQPDVVQAGALDVINGIRQVSIADLSNDGVRILPRGVRFDMDDDGYLELADWVAPDDALVAIDRNLNDRIDTGSDLFAGNFDWLDVDSDGRFTPDDPAFAYMRLWRDRDGDGEADRGEMLTLAELGVVSIHERDGQLYGHRADGSVIPIVVRDLGFDANGEMRIAMPDGGTLVLRESGEAVWTGGTVRDLSGMLTTGGGNVAGSPVFVLSTEQDVVSEELRDAPPIQRELRRITRADTTTMFSGPLAAILALGLGVSFTAEAGMIRFDLDTGSAAHVPVGSDPEQDASSEHGEDIGHDGSADTQVVPPVTGIDPDVYLQLQYINDAGGMAGAELVAHIQAILATETFEVPELPPAVIEQAGQALADAGFSEYRRSPNEQDAVPSAALDGRGKAGDGKSDGPEKDAGGQQSQADETMVEPVNRIPTAGDDSLIAIEDTINLIPAAELLGNDRDTDGDALRITAVMNAENGVAELLSDGSIRFQPDPDYFGPAGFDYLIEDGRGGSATAHAALDVLAVEDIPRLGNASLVGVEDRIGLFTSGQLLTNDADPDGDPLQLLAVGNADHGVIELLPDGMLQYTPEPDYFGDVSFDYTVTDGNGNEVTDRGTMTILPVSDAPLAAGETLDDIDEDRSLLIDPAGLLANDRDIEGDALVIVGVGNAQNGSVTLQADGMIRFVPDADFNGDAGFDYTVADSEGGHATASASFSVLPVNDAPVAAADSARAVSGGANRIDAALLLVNDVDVDGDDIRIISVGNTLNGQVRLEASGAIVFTPDDGFTGQAGFDYRIADANGLESTARVAVDVVPNTPPVVTGESLAIDEDSIAVIGSDTLLANDYDLDGQTLTIASVGNASHGTVSLDADGSIRFVPEQDFNGEAGYDYLVDDGFGGTGQGTVRVTVTPVNDAPLVNGERIANGSEDAVQLILADALLANDHDVDGDGLRLAAVANARHGSVNLNADGDVVFRPDPDFNGTASFEYTVSDGQGGYATATAEVNIAPVNDNPTAGADGLAAREDTRRVIGAGELLRNDHDVDGDTLSITSVSGAAHGRAYLSGSHVVYEPARDYAGSDSFSYTVTDGRGGYATGLVNVSVAPVNDLPYYTVGKYTNQYDRHRTDGIVRAVDPDGLNSDIRYSIGSQPLIGSATVNATTGQWSYWSNHYNNYDGAIKFTITATDSAGGMASINVPVHHFGGGPNVSHPYTVMEVYGRTSFLPVVLDLDGDGIELIPLEQSGVTFDTNGDGEASRIGWVAPDDGLLAWDRDGDAVIRHDELSFVGYGDDAASDLEGLRAFDTDNDGKLTRADDEWDSFVVWQDADSNGVSDAGEVTTLDERGITAIDLVAEAPVPDDMDSQVTAQGEYHRADGATGQLADVAFDVVADEFLGSGEADAGGADDNPETAEATGSDDVASSLDLLVSDIAAFDAPQQAEATPAVVDAPGLVAVIEQPADEGVAMAGG